MQIFQDYCKKRIIKVETNGAGNIRWKQRIVTNIGTKNVFLRTF